MILILLIPFFACSIFQLVIPYITQDDRYDWISYILSRFANIWIVFLAIFHYFILKSFKAKYKEHPFTLYIFFAVVLSATIAGVTNLQFLKSKRIDSFIIDVFAFLSLGIISLSAYRLRDEIKFGPYSVARESASKLIRFSSIQTVFALLALIQDSLAYIKKCEDDTTFCQVLEFTETLIYQGWVWWAIFYNWKMFSVNEEQEYSSESMSSGSISSMHSSVFLASNNEPIL